MSFPIAHWPDAHFPNAHWPHEAVPQGGGGGRKRKIKSFDQRQRERLEEIARYAKPPAPERPPIREMRSYKTLSPVSVKAYNAARYNDDEEAMTLIQGLL